MSKKKKNFLFYFSRDFSILIPVCEIRHELQKHLFLSHFSLLDLGVQRSIENPSFLDKIFFFFFLKLVKISKKKLTKIQLNLMVLLQISSCDDSIPVLIEFQERLVYKCLSFRVELSLFPIFYPPKNQ